MLKYGLILGMVLLLGGEARAAAAFIEGLEDVPVMEGMKQLPHDNISFGNEESRLVEALLTGNKAGYKKVQKFYISTLPQMGWTFQGNRGETLIFEREGEVLEISKEAEKPLLVRVTVKSKI